MSFPSQEVQTTGSPLEDLEALWIYHCIKQGTGNIVMLIYHRDECFRFTKTYIMSCKSMEPQNSPILWNRWYSWNIYRGGHKLEGRCHRPVLNYSNIAIWNTRGSWATDTGSLTWATDPDSLTYGLSIGQTTISLMVALAKWRPAMSSHETAAPWSMIWGKSSTEHGGIHTMYLLVRSILHFTLRIE